jgi:tungstate transport system substrate-binding protein
VIGLSRLLVRGWIWATCALAAISSFPACSPHPATPLDIATTTSVQNSGLLDTLLPAYRAETNVDVRVHAAGSGRALQMMSEGLAQLVISHAPEAEAAALSAHRHWVKSRLAHNWFVVVGPPGDSANVRGASDVAEAFRRIATAKVPFVSRGDESGTHEREKALWASAGVMPGSPHYIVSGRGMALALRHADEVQGYTLTDEATFRQLAPGLDLELLYRGDERLLNVYSVIYPVGDQTAEDFARWLTAGKGRELIGRFTIAGTRAFELEER